MKLEATLEDIAGVIHAHPTLSEAFWEASFDAMERPLHK
jgi:pyruvate/2-oxoglutarate dehydrogenase complex dihydrolipoamide dehydrogenase (E3) component